MSLIGDQSCHSQQRKKACNIDHRTVSNETHIIYTYLSVVLYNETCPYRPLKGPSNRGLCRQVVLIQRCFSTSEVDNEPTYCGLYRQVVLVRRCFSTTEVDNEPAYCGLYRHVVFIYKWSLKLRQVSLYMRA